MTAPVRIVAQLHELDPELSLLEGRRVWVPLPPAVVELRPTAELQRPMEHVSAPVARIMAALAAKVEG